MKLKTLILAATLSAGTAIAAFGHGGASGIVKQRMDSMMAMGKALATVADMFKGKATYDANKIAAAAAIVKDHAAEIDALFPDSESSREGKGTEALPAIWDDWDEFQTRSVELEMLAAELETAAMSGDKRAIRLGFAKVAKSCASCHTDFRKPKK